MARRKDIIGLAALAGLGLMMANRDKKGGVSESQIRADRDANDQKTSGDKEDMFIEPGSGPHGQKFDDELPSASAPMANLKKPSVQPGGGLAASAAPAAPAATGFKKNPGAVSPSPGNQRGPRAEELAAYTANRNVNFSNEGRSRPTATNTGSVKDIPTGGPAGYSGVKGERIDSSELGRNVGNTLAAMGPGKLSGVSKIGYEMRNADAIRKAAMAKEVPVREAVTNPLSWMAGPKNAGKFSGEVPAAGRESVTNPMSWMAGPKNADKFKEAAPSAMDKAKIAAEKFADRFRKKPMSEADTTGGAGKFGYKRGGKTKGYASGGSVSSASSRGDGIATKGKTRGKIY
jgi:hypothetical protein